MPIVSPEAQLPISPDFEASRRAQAKRAVLDQMRRVWQDGEGIALELHDGDPATTIARVAHEANAAMIVSGLGRHSVMDRLFGDETALRLIRVSAVPVLAVTSKFTQAPRRIVVAIDFSETSLRAARLALDVATSSATIYLAHVAPRDATLYDWSGVGSSYKQDAGEALQRMREQLRVPAGMIVQRVLLQGDPATELLAFAASVNADLIATGSHGHGFVARMLIGSVTTRILRCSTCSVLTVPHAAAMTRVRTAVEPPVVVSLQRPEWTAQLDEFTRRNVGRRGVLEVDDPELGAQAQEHDYPLLGASYDHHDGRVELMFGELGDVQRHLTRSIGSVSGIDVLTNERGRDIALRIAHGAGQTLLTFLP
jgi:nucleotide-binding universal stress UspA family protein